MLDCIDIPCCELISDWLPRIGDTSILRSPMTALLINLLVNYYFIGKYQKPKTRIKPIKCTGIFLSQISLLLQHKYLIKSKQTTHVYMYNIIHKQYLALFWLLKC